MADSASDASGKSASSDDEKSRAGRIRVRKRVRVKTKEAQREEDKKTREWLMKVLLYVGLIVGSLAIIWMGLRTFVREPAMPRDTSERNIGTAAERSLV